MKVEYINPFLQSTKYVISNLCNNNLEFGKAFINNEIYSTKDVTILIGITGGVKGHVLISMKDNTAKNIASTMMGGMEVSNLDEMSKSAIGELGNMIMGNTSTIFSNKGIAIDITPPTILEGSQAQISNNMPSVSVPVKISQIGELEIKVSLNEKFKK